MYTVEDFLQSKFGISCQTEGEAKQLIEKLSQEKVKWADDIPVCCRTNFSKYREKTFYFLYNGKELCYGNIDNCKGLLIVPYRIIKNAANKKMNTTKVLLKLLNGG